MTDNQQVAALGFDPARAVFLGKFVDLAYQMYKSSRNNATPPPIAMPAGYTFFAWIQMKDFIIVSGAWQFYGILAQNTAEPSKFVLAIRGTEGLTEWWDDLNAIVPVPFGGFGQVGYGFLQIYKTLRVVKYIAPGTIGAAAVVAPSMEAAGSFAHQVAAAARHAPATPGMSMPEAVSSTVETIEVAGHSLGSALATLYIAENADARLVRTPLLCTFASPRVGDWTFADKVDRLGITSWRIANELDLVPNLPAIGFWHIDALHTVNSGFRTKWSLECWHSLATYLHLLDPREPLLPQCMKSRPFAATVAAASEMRAEAALPKPATEHVISATLAPERTTSISVPAGSAATIDITIKLTPAE